MEGGGGFSHEFYPCWVIYIGQVNCIMIPHLYLLRRIFALSVFKRCYESDFTSAKGDCINDYRAIHFNWACMGSDYCII